MSKIEERLKNKISQIQLAHFLQKISFLLRNKEFKQLKDNLMDFVNRNLEETQIFIKEEDLFYLENGLLLFNEEIQKKIFHYGLSASKKED